MNLPVSVKGVVLDVGEKVVLLENERDEWELPGGRLEPGEDLRECLEREVLEELNLHVEAGPLLDAYVYEVVEGRHVLVVVYGCFVEDFSGMEKSDEHREVALFGLSEMGRVNLPEGYRKAIRAWREYTKRGA